MSDSDVPKITVREMYQREIDKAEENATDPALAGERWRWTGHITALKKKMARMSPEQLDRNAMEF